jgi:excisionase family DNA binding protein
LNKDVGEFLTTSEAADLLGVSVRTIQLWVQGGSLEAWRTAGGHRRISRASVSQLLQLQGRPPPEAQAPPPLQPAPLASALRLLIVEDDEQLLKLYERQLGSLGLPLHIVTAYDGFSGLLAIGRWHPDLVLADLAMPGLDGFQMIRALKTHPDYNDTTVVVMTGLSEAEVASRGGVPDDVRVLRKPVALSRLDQVLRDELQRKTWAQH